MLKCLTPAKINLVLEVLGRRDDGYHEIRSLLQTISLYDILSFELADMISLECTERSLQIPDNLVVQAAELLNEVSGCQKGVKITLEKRIPWDAGLGGGSSDAAATLLALNNLWELKLTALDLVDLAAGLGSDVPFFIHKGAALVEGRGEKVTPLAASMTSWFVVLIPHLAKATNKTQQLYSRLEPRYFTDGQFVSSAVKGLSQSKQIDASLLFNVFEEVAFGAFAGLEAYWRCFEQAGATNIHLVGSGPALFAPVDGEAESEEVRSLLSQRWLEAYAVSTLVE